MKGRLVFLFLKWFWEGLEFDDGSGMQRKERKYCVCETRAERASGLCAACLLAGCFLYFSSLLSVRFFFSVLSVFLLWLVFFSSSHATSRPILFRSFLKGNPADSGEVVLFTETKFWLDQLVSLPTGSFPVLIGGHDT